MSAHRIDIFNFEFWEGPPPVLFQEQGSTFTRPGANGVGQQTLGRWAQPFEATVTMWDASYNLAMLKIPLMLAIARTGPVFVMYNYINYLTVFGHLYLVDEVHPVSCQAVVQQLGPGISRLGGAELIVRFVLTPYSLI